MNRRIKENKLPIIIGATVAALGASIIGFVPTMVPSTISETTQEITRNGSISFAMVGLSLDELAQEAELIIQGKVIDKKQDKGAILGNGERTISLPLVINEIQVNKVIKGTWKDKTIGVITEEDLSGMVIVEDTAEMEQNENVFLFLTKESVYNNAYAVLGKFQGKFHIDDNNKVEENQIEDEPKEKKGLNTTEFENRIYGILSAIPKSEP
jgi:hypothetical protein